MMILFIILSLVSRATLASDFVSQITRLPMGRYAGYGARVTDGARHGADILSVGLHDMAVSVQLSVVGSHVINIMSLYVRHRAAGG